MLDSMSVSVLVKVMVSVVLRLNGFFHYNDDICDGVSNRVMILSVMVSRMVLVMAMVSVSVMVFDKDFRDCIAMLDSRSIVDSI